MTLLRFSTVDVFAERQFGGNPLAVVHEADNLSVTQMQAIAAEFNLSETTFVLKPQDPAHAARVRIFTPRAELPFAGHPNVGTGYILAREAERRGRPFPNDTMVFEELGGLIKVKALRQGTTIAGAQIAAPQRLSVGTTVAPGTVAALCGLSPSGIEQVRHFPCIVSAGVPFVFAELKSREILATASPRHDGFAANLPTDFAAGIFLYVREPKGDPPIHARMFAPLYGVPEDAATGAANVALVGLLAHLNGKPDLVLKTRIGQGFDMGRPSLLNAMATKKGGIVTGTHVGGRCVPVMSGTITLQ